MSKEKKLKLVLDANWYVSACISRKSRRTLYYDILKNPRFNVFYLAEFDRVIQRPKFVKVIAPKYINYFKAVAMRYLREIDIGEVPSLVRDRNDNYLLGMCQSCQADFLITGDLDLLVLGSYQNTTIVTMGQFFQVVSPKGHA